MSIKVGRWEVSSTFANVDTRYYYLTFSTSDNIKVPCGPVSTRVRCWEMVQVIFGKDCSKTKLCKLIEAKNTDKPSRIFCHFDSEFDFTVDQTIEKFRLKRSSLNRKEEIKYDAFILAYKDYNFEKIYIMIIDFTMKVNISDNLESIKKSYDKLSQEEKDLCKNESPNMYLVLSTIDNYYKN